MFAPGTKIKTLIVDDEPLARRNLYLLLEGDDEIEIVGECANALETLDFVQTRQVDLLFLDVQMPEINGFELLLKFDHTRIPAIVFVTAYDQYALRAFDVNAVDYLLKPFDDERFEKTLKTVKTHIKNHRLNAIGENLLLLLANKENPGSIDPDPAKYTRRFLVKTAGRTIFVKTDSIDWIGAYDYYVKLHTGKKSFLLRETMRDLEEQLDPALFVRIHRSIIVNIDRIKEIQSSFNGNYVVELIDGTQLGMSRSRWERVQTILKGGS